MKRNLFILTLLIALGAHSFAQNLGIVFEETKSWKKIVKKAKEENKLIFVDCYADWCGPCKKLAADVFTQEKVGTLFNENFINVSFNVEKDEDGKAFAQRLSVTALPTLFFIDPETEQPAHKLVGSGDANWLIDAANLVADKENGLQAMMSRYEKGDRDPVFILKLVELLMAANMEKEIGVVTKDFLNSLLLEQLATANMWPLIMQWENDPLSKTLLVVRDNIEKFYAIPGENQKMMVDMTLANAMVSKAIDFATNPNLAAYDPTNYNAFVDYLQTAEGQGKDMASIWLNTSMLSRKGDWKQMLEVMHVVDEQELFPPQVYGQYFMFFIKSLAEMKDKEALTAGVSWLDELIASATGEDIQSYSVRATMYGTKFELYQTAKKYGPAQKAKKELEKYIKLIQEIQPANQQ
ncbi:thioredoxin family protein [Thalassobellus citreus]|uniref:thioredoxin family protein n=1 Tax=Thalassobellus citreus TaxID=3367752 RepID=UPI0037B25481